MHRLPITLQLPEESSSRRTHIVNAIFDPQGKTVGWLYGTDVLAMGGWPVAFVADENVFTYTGRYAGRLEAGFFRDQAGRAVAFTQGAKGGPIPPIPEIPPVPLIPGIPPIQPIPPIPPVPSVPLLTWSPMVWDEYLA